MKSAPGSRANSIREGRGAAKFRRGGLTLMALALFVVWSAPVTAALRVCNKTRYLLNFAVGYNAGSEFTTEGWWDYSRWIMWERF